MLVNMNEVLRPAKKNKYAVGLFNAVNLELARGIIAAVEAVKQETMKKMKLFGSDGKANIGGGMSPADIETTTKLVMAEIQKQLNK